MNHQFGPWRGDMSGDDFVAIEQYLGRQVPPRYREVMAEYPLDKNDSNSQIALYEDRQTVLAANGELRGGEFSSEWDTERFAIGHSPCGDTYFLDISGASPVVFVWDHETHSIGEEAPNLDAFITEQKRYESEARVQAKEPESKRRWFSFWR
jgi:SMI1-KNR4 cell-wall